MKDSALGFKFLLVLGLRRLRGTKQNTGIK
jgi:hypothetical protein